MTFQPRDIRGSERIDLPQGMQEFRRFIRHNISAKGSIRHARRRHAVRLENLSEQGCQFWLPLRAGLPIEATIRLYIDIYGPFDAIVRWQRDGWTGIEFEFPVYPPVLDHICKTFEAGEPPRPAKRR